MSEPIYPPAVRGYAVATHSAGMAEAAGTPGVVTVSLMQVLGVLRRHLRLVLVVTMAITAIAAYLAFTAERQYRATAVIQLRDARGAITNGLVDPTLTNDMKSTTTDPILSQVQVLMSRRVAGQVVDHPDGLSLRLQTEGFPLAVLRDVRFARTDLFDTLDFHFSGHDLAVTGRHAVKHVPYGTRAQVDDVSFTVARPPGVAGGRAVVIPREAAIDSLLNSLEADPRKATDVVDVQYVATDPRAAQQVVNAVVELYQAENGQSAQREAGRRRLFIGDQLEQNDSILNVAQRALSAFRGRHLTYSSQDQFTAEQQGMADLRMRREQLDAERQTYATLLSGIDTIGGDPGRGRLRSFVLSSPDIATNPVIAQLYDQMARYETSRDSLTTGEWRSAANSPEVQRLETLIKSSREQLVGAARSYVASLDARIRVLDGLKTANAAAFQRLPGAEVEEDQLALRVDALRKVADQLREEYQKARIEEAVEAGQVEIIDEAVEPQHPIGFGPVVKLAMGVVLGLIVGGGGAFLREYADTTIRRAEEIEGVLQIPGLASIPQIALRRPAWRNRLDRLFGRRAAGGARLIKQRKRAQGATYAGAASAAEAYRLLRTNLSYLHADHAIRTIAVTSPVPEDGKTTTVANLAVTFAEQGRRVLLVDCDLRRPRLHTTFRVPREPGLAQLVMNLNTPAEAIRSTQVHGLFLLPAGTPDLNPASLLANGRLQALVQALSQEYDLLLLDCPPVLVAADAAILGTVADAVLLIVRAGHTERHSAQDALHQLDTVGARVVGGVLNDTKAHNYDTYKEYRFYGRGGAP